MQKDRDMDATMDTNMDMDTQNKHMERAHDRALHGKNTSRASMLDMRTSASSLRQGLEYEVGQQRHRIERPLMLYSVHY